MTKVKQSATVFLLFNMILNFLICRIFYGHRWYGLYGVLLLLFSLCYFHVLYVL